MPHAGEELLRHFVAELVDQDGFAFGRPRLSDAGHAATLPVLRTAAAPARCGLAAEMPEAIRAEDSGRIDRLRVHNDAPRSLYLPPGSLFRGKGTASRGTTLGVVLPPRSTAEVEVKCVQPAQPIVAGAVLDFSTAAAPVNLMRSLLTRDQGLVWACVALADPLGNGSPASPADPSPDRAQCGLVILDASGVAAAEVYDSPESWRAAAAATRVGSADFADDGHASPLKATVKVDVAVRVAKEFLTAMGTSEFRPGRADSWIARDPVAACTRLDGRVFHVVALRKDSPTDGPSPATLAPGSVERTAEPFPSSPGPTESSGAEIDAIAAPITAEDEEAESAPPVAPTRRRKVLTSGWDAPTVQSLDRYAHKEFRGDRSAAIRFLVRCGLQKRGYMGLAPSQDIPVLVPPTTASPSDLPALEMARASLEARIGDLERVARTPEYAGWLRERACLELEKMASGLEDTSLRVAARAALDRIAPVLAPTEPLEPEEVEAPQPPPPVDIRPILRQAFTESGSGRYPEALRLFDAVLEAEPDNRTALLGRAVAFRRAGKAQEALADLDLVLRMEPKNAAALLNRGRLLQERGDRRGALEAFDLLVAVAPNDWDVWMARGDVLAKMGRTEEALRSYGEAQHRNPDDASLRARIRALGTARPAAPPMTAPRLAMPRGVEEGQSYLVKERHRELSVPIFRALAGQKIPSLLITARPRAQARDELGVAGVRILGLSYALGEDVHNPTALASLTRTIERFVADHQGRAVVLLDGFDELVANNGFRDTILFVERVNEAILQSKAIFLVSLPADALPDKESALLERSLKVLPEGP